MSRSKGQVTLFIIIGLVIILTVALVLYITRETAYEPIKRIPGVPEHVQPVYDYVATCLDSISKEGIALLGAQGGYITIPAIIDKTPSSFVPNDPNGVSKVPLWFFEGEDRTPSLDFMKSELSRYVRDRMPSCINNFTSFPQYQISQGTMIPIVTFTSSSVIVELDWPLQIDGVDRSTKLDRFVVEEPVRLKEMWLLAESIMKTENDQAWFENLTIDFLASSADIPLNGIIFQCGVKKWHLTELKNTFDRILHFNIPRVRVANTNFPPPVEPMSTYSDLKKKAKLIDQKLSKGVDVDFSEKAPVDAFEVNSMMFDVGFPKTDLKVGFSYPDYDLKFIGRPNNGGILSTSEMRNSADLLRFVCINTYHFTYDVIYPVRTYIRDDSAFNGEGFVFNFAFPVVVKSNSPSRFVFGIRKFVDAEIYPEFCSDLSDDVLDVRVNGFVEGSPFAEELDGVNISYRCLNFGCNLGNTFSDGSGHVRLNTFLPYGCSNPLIIADKEGYLPNQMYVDEGINELNLKMLRSYNVSILKYPYQDPPGVWKLNQVSSLKPSQRAIISISLRNGTFDQVLTLEHNSSESLEFVYGEENYDINVLLMRNDDIIGGYHAENLTIGYNDFKENDEVVLNVVEWLPYPSGDAQRDLFSFLYDNGKFDGVPYQEELRPVFR